jgi:hypothetical protein
MTVPKRKFIPGLELNKRFYFEVVKRLLDEEFPKLKYAAGLIANGSDVLGLDDPTSMDHNWGPRMRIILPEKDFDATQKAVDRMLRRRLPKTFMGFPTNFTEENKDKNAYLKQQMQFKDRGDVNHLIRFYTIKGFFEYFIGTNPQKKLSTEDWLVMPEQSLLEVTSGEVFFDNIGFAKFRSKFAYYPKDVWIYLLYVQWDRLANNLGFPGRIGTTGDELGSRMVANHVIEEMVKMMFLIRRRYQPYAKWRGKVFRELGAKELTKLLINIMNGKKWQTRQKYINEAHLLLGKYFNDLKITKPIPLKTMTFHGRDFEVADIKYFRDAAQEAIPSKKLRNMRYPLGSIDQFTDHAKISHLDYVYKNFKDIIK